MDYSLNELDFVRKAIGKERIRLDKRTLTDSRLLSIQPGNRLGQVMVRLGDTKVYCSVSADIVVPPADRPFEGIIQVFTEIFPGAHSPDASSQDLDITRLSVQRLLERSIKTSRAVDCESLCILPGQKIWSVRVDVHVLDDDGCVGDAALIAAISALYAFKRPVVEVVDGHVKVYSEFERHPVPLTVMHCPLPVSFSFLSSNSDDSGNGDSTSNNNNNHSKANHHNNDDIIVIVDPTAIEEKALHGFMTIVLNSQRELIAAVKAGGLPIPSEVIAENCMSLAKEKAMLIHNIINQFLHQ